MRAQRSLGWVVALLALAAPARAALPDGTLVVTKGASVEADALPLLLSLGGGVFSTIEILAPLQVAPSQPTDLLTYQTGAGFAQPLDATTPVPSAETPAYYFDPASQATLPASIVPSGTTLDALPLRLADGREQSVAQLLDAPGSLVVFSLPEPRGVALLVLGALEVAWLARRRAADERAA